jgi:3'-phosphoadenosine 5'-phosphosulfate sulfotransferase (PAPS reductase)/FAD synthetase
MSERIVVWFSAGAASAVAAKLTLAAATLPVELVYTDPGSEHPDNQRFIADCEQWFNHPVIQLKSDVYSDTWDVWEKRKFIVSPQGAPCTTYLKKRLRQQYQRPDDIQVFGYTVEEQHRADRFREQNPEVNLVTPLIEHNLGKDDVLAIVHRAGIELPAMYQLGYRNNNCIGCPKGGIGYWNKIRKDFPEVFDRMSNLEQDLGTSILKDRKGPIWLATLDPERGNHQDEPSIECSLFCQIAEEYVNNQEETS